MKTAKQILLDAADLLEKPGAWTQGNLAKTARGIPTAVYDNNACCWCMMGAIFLVGGRQLPFPAYDTMKAVCGMSAPRFNDAPDRTQAEVVAKLREAAELA